MMTHLVLEQSVNLQHSSIYSEHEVELKNETLSPSLTHSLPAPQMMTGRRSMRDWQSWMRETGCWEVVMRPPSSLLLPKASLFPLLSPQPPFPPLLRSAPRTRPAVTWLSLWLTSSSTRIPPSRRWVQPSLTDPASHHQRHPVRVSLQV